MSPPSAAIDVDERTARRFAISRDILQVDDRFETHLHQEDQVAWTVSGSADLDILGERWSLRSDRLVWIPAGTMHRMVFTEPTDLISIYIDPRMRQPGDRDEPRTMMADPLATALMLHLVDRVPSPARREHCCRLLAEILPELPVLRDMIVLPREPRARSVAVALLEDPADQRTLEEWAAGLGVSAKTLARSFVAGTGSTFRQWRVHARLRQGTRLLTEGATVQETAAVVGYSSTGSFIVAFRSRFGATPARYAAAQRRTSQR